MEETFFRNNLSIKCLLVVLFVACKSPVKTENNAEVVKGKPPNILFLFTDDQRYGTLGVLQQDKVLTPNLDKLVKNGTYFNNAYILGAPHGAVCSPSSA